MLSDERSSISVLKGMFDINKLTAKATNKTRYARRIATLVAENRYIDSIASAVEASITNIKDNIKSFVIYGEPQSGKTELMIALSARLLDDGFKIIIVLLNDSVQLLDQNLERFQRSGIDPSPKKFSEILDKSIKIGDSPWIIFCKKNSQDLQKLISKLKDYNSKIVIDDEADYATPNAKINKQDKSRINELTESLIGKDGVYIGVTATPARLDLNNTHDNQNDKWVDFLPHPQYTGQEIFFPTPLNDLPYLLNLLPDEGDDPKYIREALFNFMVNVAHLNQKINKSEINYSILIHTSGKKVDHSEDYKQVVKIFEALRDQSDVNFEKYYKRIWEIAKERYPNEEDEITEYVAENKNRNNIVVMNSDKEKNVADNKSATSPSTLFTIVIGGNIVSRGVTFENLLSMFFTRDVKHRFQQDTYIQRARMFGTRGAYLNYFELSIPETLYLNWHKCFIFHRLSLASRRTGNGSPVWLEDGKISPASSSSIDQTTVTMHSGEMSFDMFDYNQERIQEVFTGSSNNNLEKLKILSQKLGDTVLPNYLLDYIQNFSPNGDSSIAIHDPRKIDESYTTADIEQIKRPRGFIGDSELAEHKYPQALHHIFIIYNPKNKARVFYKYKGNIKFIKKSKKK